jgi:hypothetical protein
MQLTGTSESALQSAIRASETKYFPYFERGAGGSGSLIQDLRNQTYYSFATVRVVHRYITGILSIHCTVNRSGSCTAACMRYTWMSSRSKHALCV